MTVWVPNSWKDTINQNREGSKGEFEHNVFDMTEGHPGGNVCKTDVQKPLKEWFKAEIQITG